LEQDSVGHRRFAAIVEMGTHTTIISGKTFCLMYKESTILAEKGGISTTQGTFLDEDYDQLQLENVEKYTKKYLTI
jgi:hypothetical protein